MMWPWHFGVRAVSLLSTSPAGETYQLTCEQDHSIVSWEWTGTNPRPFLIRKVAEPVPFSKPDQAATRMPEMVAPPRGAKTPFLVETGDRQSEAEARETPVPAVSPVSRPDPNLANLEDLDLLCRQVRDEGAQTTVWVCLRTESAHHHENPVTNGCTTFNEFDAEICRLHAQLDQIRYRARKKFYEAQIVAAGA
jgi:hypothetical protein